MHSMVAATTSFDLTPEAHAGAKMPRGWADESFNLYVHVLTRHACT
jgi:hypothetical protein